MATRQTSTNGKPKSPRIQVVLPEKLFERLEILAEEDSRTISNMAKVLIEKGIKNLIERKGMPLIPNTKTDTDTFRNKLESQRIKRLKGAPKRIRYLNNNDN